MEAPLTTLPPVRLEWLNDGVGIAQQVARNQQLQARILWIDATANLDRINSAAKIASLVHQIKSVGFNTIVFDVKPIVGYTLYPSKLTEKLTKWKGQTLPLSFDPLREMVAVCRQEGMPIYASMNTFAEGHRNVATEKNAEATYGKPGPGYERPDDQTVLYEPEIRAQMSWGGDEVPVNPVANPGSPSADRLNVYVRASAPKNPIAGAYGAVVDADGLCVASIGPSSWEYPGVPEGGSVLLATGKVGQWIQGNLTPGRRVVFQTKPNFIKISERPDQQIPLMLNPHKPEVRDRVLAFVREIAMNYAVNGIVFDDRLRFGGLNADFSPTARKAFEAFVGKPIQWPADVFEFTANMDLTKGVRPGKYYDSWFAWRAQTLRDWVRSARETIQSVRPGCQLSVYAGSWYGEYWRYGNNYASTSFRAGFQFLNDNYRRTGFADQLDFLMTGCYYGVATVNEALQRNLPAGRTVEAAGQLSNRAVRDQSWVYAGIQLMDFKGRPQKLMEALQAACGSTQGVMCFDLSHDIEKFWPVFARAFSQPRTAPHAVPGLIDEVRKRRAAVDATGQPDPPVIIREGAPGIGL